MMGQGQMRASTNNHRKDRTRERFEPRFDAYDVDTYFEDLKLDSRIRHLADYPIYRSSGHHRPFDTREIGRLPRSRVMETFNNPRTGPVVRQRKDVLPFGRAMRNLVDNIVRAEQFYSNFKGEFDGEIGQIKKYATADVLDELWRLRINGKKDPRTVLEGEENENDEALQKSKGQFDVMKRDITHALNVALESTLKDGTNESPRTLANIGAAKRMQGKVEIANEQILELLTMVKKGREHCVALLGEFEFLKGLIDPEAEKNKPLFRSYDGGIDIEEEDGDYEGWEH